MIYGSSIYTAPVNESNILDNVPTINVIPENCISFGEAALYVSDSIEESYNEMMQSIGLNELSYFESTGKEIVYEDADSDTEKKGLFAAIKGFFTKVFGAIKDLFTKAFNWIKEHVEKFTNAVKEKIQSIVGKVVTKQVKKLDDAIKVSDKFGANKDGKEKKYGKFTPDSVIDKYQKKFNSECASVLARLQDDSDELENKYSIKDTKSTFKEAYKKGSKEITRSNIASVKAELEKWTDGGKFIDSLKSAYNGIKSSLNKAYKDLKNSNKKDGSDDLKKKLKNTKTVTQYLTSYFGMLINAYKLSFADAAVISMKIIVSANKAIRDAKKAEADGETKATGESVSYTSGSDLVEEAFNW